VATVHDSGAERALLADLAHELAVPLADLADDTLATIGAMLDDGLAPTNPLDVWGTGADTRKLFGACLRAMAADSGVGVTALAVDMVTEFDGDTAYADAVLDVANNTDAPMAVLTSVPSAIDAPTAQRLRDSGIPVLEGFRSGLAALGHVARWPLPIDRSDEPASVERRVPDGASAFELLAAYGIPVVPSRTAHSIGEALAAGDEFGYPVVLKTFGALHKSDVGGVALDLADDAALSLAYTAMAQSLGPATTVQPMVADGVEVSVGFVRDEAFGPLLVVAAGGTLVELLADRVVACPPVSHAGALALLDRLRIRPVLAGWRGAPAVDIDALADVIVAFSVMAIELGDVVDAVEANPVIASPRGVVAVDALVQASRAES
jgi:acyl-CoA synthetase (NDP forming)